MKRVWSWATWLSLMVVSGSARAQQIPFRVEYRAAPTCPGADDFSSQVIERSRQLRLSAHDEPASSFELDLVERDASFVGTLRLREQNGRTTERELASTSCEEVVSALALIAAVLLDPTANETASAARTTPRASTPPTRAVPARGARPRPSRARDAAGTPDPIVAPRREPRARAAVLFGAGLGVALEDAVSPSVAPGFFAEVDAEVNGRGALRPLFALQVVRTLTAGAETQAGTAELTWTAARLLGCPVAWAPGETLSLRPCASAEAGLLDATGTDTTRQADSQVPWFAAGVGARLEARPGRVLRLALDGAAVMPLKRDRFFFEPDVPRNTAFQVPAAGASARLGLIVLLN